MKPITAGELFFVVLISLTGCASSRGAGAPASRDRNAIGLDEIQATTHSNAYELIEALRPQWLRVRAPSVTGRNARLVYLDEQYLGGLGELRQIATSSIAGIHFYDGPAATQKWGTGHTGGVIQIVTRRE